LNYSFKDIVLRTVIDPKPITPAVARELRLLDADMPLAEIETMIDYLNDRTADMRFTTLLLAVFAASGTLLSVIGAYGVTSYLVAQRTHELGVRRALGADSGSILWLILRQGMAMGLEASGSASRARL
jgi:putative ABC transport system permease protein